MHAEDLKEMQEVVDDRLRELGYPPFFNSREDDNNKDGDGDGLAYIRETDSS